MTFGVVKGKGKRELTDTLKTLNFWYLSIFIVGFGIYFIVMPKFADDYWFMEYLKPWFDQQGIWDPDGGGNIFKAGIPWKEIIETWQSHYYDDNCRLGNIIVVVMLLFPKWLGSGITLMAFAYAITGSFKLVGIDWRNSMLVPIGLLMYYLSVPWYDMMGSLVYQYNYILPTGLSIWLLNRIFDNKATTKWIVGTFMLALITGAWHEGFSFPLVIGLTVSLFYRKWRNLNTYMGIAGLLIGLIFLYQSPGMRERGTDAISDGIHLPVWLIIDIVKLYWAYFMAITMIAACLLVKTARDKIIGCSRIVCLTVVCIVPLALLVVVFMEPRVAWLGTFLSVTLCIGILNVITEWFRNNTGVIKVTIGMVCVIPVIVSLAFIDVDCFKYRTQMHRIVSKFSKDPLLEVVCEDYETSPQKPMIQLDMPGHAFANIGLMYIHKYYNSERGRIINFCYILPEKLRGFTSDSGCLVGGENEVREYRGYYVAPYNGADIGLKKGCMEMDLGKGYVWVRINSVVFISEADGKKYIFIDPQLSWYLSHFKNVRRVGKMRFD